MASPAVSTHPLIAVTVPQLQAVLGVVSTVVGIVVALGAGILVLPKVELAARLRWAEKRAATAETALGSVSAALSALEGRVAALHSEVVQLRKTQVVSARYTARLVIFSRSRRPASEVPQPPDEISDDVLEQIRALELEQDAAVQGASGIVPGPVTA